MLSVVEHESPTLAILGPRTSQSPPNNTWFNLDRIIYGLDLENETYVTRSAVLRSAQSIYLEI